MEIDVANANANAKGIVPHAKSSSSMGACIIDCINLSFIVLGSMEANGMALAHHSAFLLIWPMLMPLPKEFSPVPKVRVLQ
jgi:hypothetical protein